MTKEERVAYQKAWYIKNRVRILAKARERNATPEAKAKQAEYDAKRDAATAGRVGRAKERYSKPQNKAWHKAHYAKPEVKAKTKERNTTPKYKAKRKEYTATPEGKANITAIGRKRRAKKAGVGHEKYIDLDIFKRDNWTCQLCGKKIDRRFKWPNPLSKSIDHIIAIINGGLDAPHNVQAAHLLCNMEKSTKNIGQLRLAI